MGSPTTVSLDELRRRLDALREEHGYITSVDVCCHCGDPECDGIGCIASIDPDLAGRGDSDHFDRLEELHQSFRDAQAWRALNAIVDAGEEPLVAYMLAREFLANANNQAVEVLCEECDSTFLAQGPCDTTCTACRLTRRAEPREELSR